MRGRRAGRPRPRGAPSDGRPAPAADALALDWASRPYASNVLRGKPVAVIGASPRPSGAARAQSEARVVLGAIGAEVLDAELAVARVSEHFDDDGRLAALAHRRDLRKLLARLVTLARDASREVAAA